MSQRFQYLCMACPNKFVNGPESNAHHDATGHHQTGRCPHCNRWLSQHSDSEYALCEEITGKFITNGRIG